MKGYEMSEISTGLGGLVVEEVEKFHKRNPAPYREVFDNLRKGVLGTITVPTGEIIQDGPNKGRGKTELDHERGFRDVASERGVGLRVSRQQLANGTTKLGLYVTDKREFSPEAMKKRDESLAKTRAKKAAEKAARDKIEAAKVVQHPAAPTHKAQPPAK